jgi:hypothetical protein
MLTLWLPFNYHHSHAATIVFATVYGLVSGGFISLMIPCVFKLGSLETLGQRFGTFQVVVAARLVYLPEDAVNFHKDQASDLNADIPQYADRTADHGSHSE